MKRRRHVIDDGVQHRLHTLVPVRRAAQKHDLLSQACWRSGWLLISARRVPRPRGTCSISVSSCSATASISFVAVFFGQFLRGRPESPPRTSCHRFLVPVDFGLHPHQVDDAAEVLLRADGQLNGHGVGVKPVVHHADDTEEIRAHDVHLVDVGHAGHTVLAGLLPDRFGLRLDTATWRRTQRQPRRARAGNAPLQR